MTKRAAILLALLAVLAGVLAFVVTRPPPAAGRPGAGRLDVAFSVPPPDDAHASLRVLFVGNSFTFVNDLPTLVRGLAAKDGVVIAVASAVAPGAKLAQHAANPAVRAAMTRRYDVVVLQEQSQIPAYEENRREDVEPALVLLRDAATANGSRPLLFATWGYRGGDPMNVKNDSYEAMQARLDAGFDDLSARTGVAIVPVGRAWAAARREHPEIDLWGPDGKHPSVAGSYLAACVFFGTLLHRSPVGNAFIAGLSVERARTLQAIAAR